MRNGGASESIWISLRTSLFSRIIYALWLIIYESYLWSCIVMRIWWWWKMDDSYGLKERLWVILSPQVKSLERWMQGSMDGRISPNCKRRYKDPRTADLVGIFKVDEGIHGPPIWSMFLKGYAGINGPPIWYDFSREMQGSTNRRISPKI